MPVAKFPKLSTDLVDQNVAMSHASRNHVLRAFGVLLSNAEYVREEETPVDAAKRALALAEEYPIAMRTVEQVLKGETARSGRMMFADALPGDNAPADEKVAMALAAYLHRRQSIGELIEGELVGDD